MSGESVGCQHLLRAVSRCKPKLHCFGHIHEGWGAERVRWKSGSIEEDCVETSEKVEVEVDKMREQKSAFVDISDSAEKPLQFGKETLMVNASIMNFTYKPWQGPWLVDLGLERATEGEEGVSN